MHTNMFSHGATQDEVYAALQEDEANDSKTIRFMDIVLVVATIYLVRDLPTWDLVAVLAIAFAGMRRLFFFIDQSNRNFLMHMLDWQRAMERKSR